LSSSARPSFGAGKSGRRRTMSATR
jgi:hypothetical protein